MSKSSIHNTVRRGAAITLSMAAAVGFNACGESKPEHCRTMEATHFLPKGAEINAPIEGGDAGAIYELKNDIVKHGVLRITRYTNGGSDIESQNVDIRETNSEHNDIQFGIPAGTMNFHAAPRNLYGTVNVTQTFCTTADLGEFPPVTTAQP